MNHPSSKKFLVTGGAGFIGSHLTEALLKAGNEVVVLDEFNDYYDVAIKEGNVASARSTASLYGQKLTIVRGDIRDCVLVDSTFAEHGFTGVFHLAARAGVRPSIADPRLYFSANVDGTLNLLEASRKHGVRDLIFASSSSVYGVNTKVPFAEDDLIHRTISPYAASKIAGEQLCSNYAHLFGLRCMCLRLFTVYGPRQRPDLAISKFTTALFDGTPVDRYGDGSTSRDYTYVDDIVNGLLAASRYTDKSSFEIINLGGSAVTTLDELIALTEAAVGAKAIIRQLPEQAGDVPRTYADTTKAARLLGYRAKTNIREGVSAYVKWRRDNAASPFFGKIGAKVTGRRVV